MLNPANSLTSSGTASETYRDLMVAAISLADHQLSDLPNIHFKSRGREGLTASLNRSKNPLLIEPHPPLHAWAFKGAIALAKVTVGIKKVSNYMHVCTTNSNQRNNWDKNWLWHLGFWAW
jgi:hypothetical protein